MLIRADPNVSEEAKQHAREVLEAAGIQRKLDTHSEEEHQHRVLAGYKAAIHSKIHSRTTQYLLIVFVSRSKRFSCGQAARQRVSC